MCGWEGVGVLGRVGDHILQEINTLFFWQDSEPTKLPYHPHKNLGGEGASDR